MRLSRMDCTERASVPAGPITGAAGESTLEAPNVSVIVTTFRSGDYLEKCLASLRCQTLSNLEVIIVNDCSPDPRDDEISRRFVDSFPRCKYIQNAENLGTGRSREVGVAAAAGEYVGFLDSDDYVRATAFQTLYEEAKKHECDIAVANFEVVDDWERDTSGGDLPAVFLSEIVEGWELFESQLLRLHRPYYLRVDWWNKIYRRDLFEKNKVSFPNVVRNEGVMSMIVSLLANRCVILDIPLFYTSIRPDSVCRSITKRHIADTIRSTLHFREWLRRLGVLDKYYDQFLKFFYYVIFNHNIKLSNKLVSSNRNALLKELAESLRKDHTCWLDFLRYINLKEKHIERLVLSTIDTHSYTWDILKLIRNTDFVERRRIGAAPVIKSGRLVRRPRVSLVTVVKDLVSGGRLDVFRQMLASVQAQTFPRQEIEHVVIDGNSQDGTVDYLSNLVEEGLLSWVLSEPDSGIYNAMNKGAMAAGGEFVLYLNSDDYLAPDALARLYGKAQSASADYVFGNAVKVDETGNKVGTHIGNIDKVFYGAPYCHQAMLCRRRCFRDAYFDESFRITMWAYALALYERGYRHAYVNETVAFFRVGGISTDPKFRESFKLEQDRIKRERIVPRLPISFDEYEFLNGSWRKWPTSEAGLSITEILARLSYPENSFQRAFLKATLRLCEDVLSREQSGAARKTVIPRLAV